jgi:hypothetical protein
LLLGWNKAILLFKSRDQVILSNLDFFDGEIGRNMDDLNSVKKWLKHVGCGVRCANKDAF